MTLSVKFLVNQHYGGVSGLTRYEQRLLKELASLPDLNVQVVGKEFSQLPRGVVRLGNRAGLGLDVFSRIYPVRWPPQATGLVHLPHRTQSTLLTRKGARKTVITVHDILHFQYRHNPEMHIYRHSIQAWFDRLSVRALARSDAVIASSEYTRRALIEEAGIPEALIHVVYLGVDHDQFSPQQVSDEFKSRFGLDEQTQYILHVSTEEPRKNFVTLLRAFHTIWQQNRQVKLLKVGRPLYPAARQKHLELVAELGLQDAVVFIDHVSDEELTAFYNIASIFVFPSLGEGFGLPILESMACGTPVVCSNATSLPELAGNGALLVEPMDSALLAEKIYRLLNDSNLRQQMRADGLEQAARFSWQNTAIETMNIYRSI